MITLQDAIKLSGVEDWTLTPRQKIFLLESTRDLLDKHDPAWFQENRERLKDDLRLIFKEI